MIVAFVCLVAMAAGSAPAAAHPDDVSTQRQREIEQEKAALQVKIRAADRQANDLVAQIAESDRRRGTLEREVVDLGARLEEASARLAETEAFLNEAQTELFSLEAGLAATLQRIEALRDELRQRTRSADKAGPAAYVGMVLSARSYRSFVSRLAFVGKVFGQDRSRIDSVERLGRQLDERRAVALQRRTEVAAQKAALEEHKAAIEDLQARVAASRAEVVRETANRKQLLARVQADRAGYLKAMARLEEESKTIAALLRSRQRGQVFQAGSGSRLAWPTTGTVESGFGWRTHPIYGDRRFHTGIDIGAPSGQRVIAAESGEVIYAGEMGGYGLVVVVDHGGALATLYAHLRTANVTRGVRVDRASVVGAVGCSGYCTGPHLHFETRINGDPVDPMQFF